MYLRRTGRVSNVTAVVGTVLNIKPVLQIQGEGVDAFAKVAGFEPEFVM